ncbi:uncharacterized protein [Hyperolius riggenbachi]|uniref:uncharacterized protein isoform X2 n=1 Tax=Hyperolius riggenbachi TaxID=752182 RepID=UPI0035A3A16C
MVSIYNWILNKVLILRNGLVGLREVEPALPHPWSLKSPFERWTIYSKVLLAASIICFITFLILHLGKRTAVSAAALVRRPSAPALKTPVLCERTLLDMWRYYLVLLLILCLFFSVPWEWFRLYKIEVAKKTRVLSEGYARSCYQADQSFWEILKIWMSWNFSWDTGSCESYYKALMVDPFWEVNPLMRSSGRAYPSWEQPITSDLCTENPSTRPAVTCLSKPGAASNKSDLCPQNPFTRPAVSGLSEPGAASNM